MYSSVMLVYKAMKAGSPDYIRGMFSNDYGRMTRQALSGMIKPSQSTQVPRTEIAATSFRHRALRTTTYSQKMSKILLPMFSSR